MSHWPAVDIMAGGALFLAGTKVGDQFNAFETIVVFLALCGAGGLTILFGL